MYAKQTSKIALAKAQARAFSIAELDLHHPLKPNPNQALICIKNSLHYMTMTEYQDVFPAASAAGINMHFVARRTEHLLREQGKLDDADYVSTLLQRLLSDEARQPLDHAVQQDEALMRKLKRAWAANGVHGNDRNATGIKRWHPHPPNIEAQSKRVKI
ncbi:hypothetical protein LTR56_016108 [Elasticomyces elasticus]|nr:hypothetical protein LTR56_016108 [Elasticomyces elasticus]KAK3636235.1 hypothetical protein LTR22_018840 [Elasticomyces elasticus]KAK5762713.1 hypothetical protein LTS12_007102 [Elasticomyces elasticus]